MITSTYDLCPLIITTKNGFGVVEMQTDNTIILADESFSALKKNKLINIKFIAKSKKKLTPDSPLIFNGYILT
jgi:hypothetical protein